MDFVESRYGWRLFYCINCRKNWEESTNDYFSDDKVECRKCGEYCIPLDRGLDDNLNNEKIIGTR